MLLFQIGMNLKKDLYVDIVKDFINKGIDGINNSVWLMLSMQVLNFTLFKLDGLGGESSQQFSTII